MDVGSEESDYDAVSKLFKAVGDFSGEQNN
jgi:hypothetical protein